VTGPLRSFAVRNKRKQNAARCPSIGTSLRARRGSGSLEPSARRDRRTSRAARPYRVRRLLDQSVDCRALDLELALATPKLVEELARGAIEARLTAPDALHSLVHLATEVAHPALVVLELLEALADRQLVVDSSDDTRAPCGRAIPRPGGVVLGRDSRPAYGMFDASEQSMQSEPLWEGPHEMVGGLELDRMRPERGAQCEVSIHTAVSVLGSLRTVTSTPNPAYQTGLFEPDPTSPG
jgi:hypothetical protein